MQGSTDTVGCRTRLFQADKVCTTLAAQDLPVRHRVMVAVFSKECNEQATLRCFACACEIALVLLCTDL